jgi:hypothetical protein
MEEVVNKRNVRQELGESFLRNVGRFHTLGLRIILVPRFITDYVITGSLIAGTGNILVTSIYLYLSNAH